MKKAKIFLTVLTVLTVVGGALAFKAKAPKELFLCDVNAGVCTVDANIFTSYKTTATTAEGIRFEAGKFNDLCVEEDGILTCTTKITVDPAE